MQFLTLASLFSVALAAPACSANYPTGTTSAVPSSTASSGPSYENIDISDFIVRENNGIQSVTFKLSGDDAKSISCSSPGAIAQIPSDVYGCTGNEAYSFGLVAPTADTRYGLIVYHQTSPFAGKSGTGNIATVGNAGGNGPADMVYQQFVPSTIVIQ